MKKYQLVGQMKNVDKLENIYRNNKNGRMFVVGENITEITSEDEKKALNILWHNFEKNKRKKVVTRVSILGVVSSLVIGVTGFTIINKEHIEYVNKIVHEQDNDITEDYIMSSLKGNKTVDPLMKKGIEFLINSFTKEIISQEEIYIDKYININKRIADYDFSNLTIMAGANDYIDMMCDIFCGNRFIESKMLMRQFYEQLMGLEISDASKIFGYLNVPVKGNVVNSISDARNSRKDYVDVLKEASLLTDEEILDILECLEKYNNKSITKEVMYLKLRHILIPSLTQNYNHWNIDKLALISEIFDGPVSITNNIFSDQYNILYKDSEYGDYKMYIDKATDISLDYKYYHDKLTKLLEEKGNNLDYEDQDTRFLVYLYTLMRLSNRYDDVIFENKTPGELATLMMEDGLYSVNKKFIYAYLTNGTINFEDLFSSIRLYNLDALSLAMFQEVNICLREELAARKLDPVEYNDFLMNMIDNLQEELIYTDDITAFDVWFKYHEYDYSMIKDFNFNQTNFTYDEDVPKSLINKN